jgi:integrase
VKHIIGTLKSILNTALDDQAIASNPVVANRRRTTKHNSTRSFKHRPLTSSQVAALADWITDTTCNDLYAFVVVFAAYTGVRAAELQGLQVRDVTRSDIPGTVGAVRISRTAARRRVQPGQPTQWVYGTPKSDASTNRVVPLAPWLADDLRAYLSRTHCTDIVWGGRGSNPRPTDYESATRRSWESGGVLISQRASTFGSRASGDILGRRT